MTIQDALSQCRWFSRLSADDMAALETVTTIRELGTGDMIFLEGDPAEAFFAVGSGRVKVFKLSPEGREQILMIARAGDTFAEAAVFSSGTYPASAQALEATSIVIFQRQRFVDLLGKRPGLALAIIGRLSELLRHMTNLVEGLSLTDVSTRLARHILSLLDSVDSSEPLDIILTDTKATLASQLGTIPETLSRSLAKLAKDGVLAVDGPVLKVLDLPALKRVASGEEK